MGFLDPDFFVYSDETDFCKRLHDAGWDVLYVPAARAIHHDQLTTDPRGARRRIVEFHRNRDLYMRKHHVDRHAAARARAQRALLPRAWRSWRPCRAGTRSQALSPARAAGADARPRRRASARRPRSTTAGRESLPATGGLACQRGPSVEHPDLAQIAAVVAAAGAAVLLGGRGRAAVLGGLVLVAWRRPAWDLDLGHRPARGSGLAGGRRGGPARRRCCSAAPRRWPSASRRGCRWPCSPRRRCDHRSPSSRAAGFPLSLAEDGQLGRLLPLYFVLAAAALALAWRTVRGDSGAARALPRAVALPAAGFLAFACLSLTWADQLDAGAELLVFFTVPFALLMGVVARAPFPDWAPRALFRIGVALAAIFAAIGLYQAITRELFFFAPNLAVSNANSDYFRVTSLFGDPSLYGRHLVLGIGLLLVVLALGRIDLRLGIALLVLMWAGLFVSYSQSSMVALVAVTLAIAAATGGRQVRLVVGVGLALVCLLGVGFLASIELRGDSLRRETSDRTQRVEDTARVVSDAPVVGVGIGGQPTASRRLSGRDRPTPNFVSHTTPLTVAAELGAIGLALYVWLLVGGARTIAAVGRLEPALGLALGAVAAGALRARAVLQRFPRGPAHMGGAGGGGRLPHLDPPRRRRRTARPRRPRRDGPLGRTGGSPATPCSRCSGCCWRCWRSPCPSWAPTPGRSSRRRDAAAGSSPRSCARQARSGTWASRARPASWRRWRWRCVAALALRTREDWPAWVGTALARRRGARAAAALDAAAGGPARGHRAVVLHQRLDVPDRDRRRPAAGRRQPLRPRLPRLGHGALLHLRRHGRRARTRARGLARALRLLPGHGDRRCGLAAGALAVRRLPRCSCC